MSNFYKIDTVKAIWGTALATVAPVGGITVNLAKEISEWLGVGILAVSFLSGIVGLLLMIASFHKQVIKGQSK